VIHRVRVLSVSLALILCACGGKQSNTQRPPPNFNSPAATVSTRAPGAKTQPAEKPTKGTRLNQDSAETEDKDSNNSAGDTAAHNPLLAAVASTVTGSSAAYSQAALAGPSAWQAGVDYTRLVPAQPTDAPQGQVEVLEFFWYACPHCNDIDPLVEAWKKNNPSWVTFTRVPVLWNENHRALAHLFYTLSVMGKLTDDVHEAIFKEIHVNGNPLTATDPSEVESDLRVQAAFVKRLGLPDATFRDDYNTMAVLAGMRHADELVQRFRVTGVPTFVVNGKYVADVQTAKTPERLIALVGDLAAIEHKR
jgi:thiol:disulfide interchange protein DsbA